MFEQHHVVDLHENGSFGDSKSWLSGDQSSPPPHQRTHSSLSNGNGNNSNFDRLLYKNLVEMVPLVESLMDRRANTSFTRSASLIYTKTPSRESYPKKITDPKGRKAGQSILTKKRRDLGDKDPGQNSSRENQDACADDISIFSSRAMAVEKDKEELIILREQVEDLQKKLLEKDVLLKSTEISNNEMTAVHAKLDELKHQVAEKDSLIRSTRLQLSDTKIKLADKQAALEKLQWEAMTSNKKVDKLQEDLDSMQGEISSFMQLFEGLTKNDSTGYAMDYDITPYHLEQLPYIDDLDEMEMQKMEEAREAYVAAVAAAKEMQDEGSLAIAANARSHLHSFVFRSNNMDADEKSPII